MKRNESQAYIAGSILLDPTAALEECARRNVTEEWFTDHLCKAVFLAARAVQSEGGAVLEEASIAAYIRQNHLLDDFQASHFDSLMDGVTTVAHLAHYIGVAAEDHKRRMANDLSVEIRQALKYGASSSAVIDKIQSYCTTCSLMDVEEEPSEIWIKRMMSNYRKAREKGGYGVVSRFFHLQRLLFGYPPQMTTVLAGPTKHGKTTLALNEILDMVSNGDPVDFFSLEMPKDQIREKLAADMLGIEWTRIRAGKMKTEEESLIEEAFRKIDKFPLRIYDAPMTPEKVVSLMHGRASKVKVFFLDYFGLLQRSKSDPSNDAAAFSRHSNLLTNAAKHTKTHLVVLAQLNRDSVEVDRKTGRPIVPRPTHLKGSGTIEQDSGRLIMVYQDPDCGTHLLPDDVPTYLDVQLNRFGETGRELFTFRKRFSRLIAR